MIHHKILLPLLSFSIIALTACEPSAQDSGSSSKVSVNGISEDGFVSGAVVWHDINNDKELDNGEPFALTDDEGYFSQSRTVDGKFTNYCATSATTEEKRHCLQVNATNNASTDIIIRLQKGIDIVTGEPFVGSISLGATVDANGVISDVVATPITAMIVHMSGAQLTDFANREKRTNTTTADMEKFLKSDFLDFVFTGTPLDPINKPDDLDQVNFIKAALQVHKSVELANTLLLKRYPIVGDSGVPSDASDFVYQAITENFIAASGTKLSEFMEPGKTGTSTYDTTATTLATIFQRAEALLVQAIKDAGKTQGTDEGFPTSSVDIALWRGLAGRVLETTNDIKEAITPAAGAVATFDKSEMFARAKAVEIIKEGIKNQIEDNIDYGTDGSTIPTLTLLDDIPAQKNARKFVDAANIAVLKANGDNINIIEVVKNLKDAGNQADATAIQTLITNTIKDGGTAFRPDSSKLFDGSTVTISGKEISLDSEDTSTTNIPPITAALLTATATDSGKAQSHGKSKIFFASQGDNNKFDDTTGSLVICNLFNDGKEKINAAETQGLFIGGTWKKINDFTVQLNATISGQPRTIIVKSLGFKTDKTTNVVSTTIRKYSADFNGEVKEFNTDTGLVDSDPNLVLKTDNAGCKTLLGSSSNS